VGTHTSPADWWHEDEATVLTVAEILREVARAGRGSKRKGGGDDGGT
jgi:hypothetical protein